MFLQTYHWLYQYVSAFCGFLCSRKIDTIFYFLTRIPWFMRLPINQARKERTLLCPLTRTSFFWCRIPQFPLIPPLHFYLRPNYIPITNGRKAGIIEIFIFRAGSKFLNRWNFSPDNKILGFWPKQRGSASTMETWMLELKNFLTRNFRLRYKPTKGCLTPNHA